VWEDVGGATAWRGRLGYQFQKAGRNQWRWVSRKPSQRGDMGTLPTATTTAQSTLQPLLWMPSTGSWVCIITYSTVIGPAAASHALSQETGTRMSGPFQLPQTETCPSGPSKSGVPTE
jgi:hypothetical protein